MSQDGSTQRIDYGEAAYALGRVYGYAAKIWPDLEQPDRMEKASRSPMFGMTQAVALLAANRKMTPTRTATIAAMMDSVPVSFPSEVVDPRLQGIWWMGFYHAMSGKNHNNIAYFRRKKKMTQLQLADKIDVSQKDISRWENGVVAPSLESLEKLAAALACAPTDLVRHPPIG